MKKVELERILQSLRPVIALDPKTEPYATPAGLAAEVVVFALGRSDIADRSVLDLGCGNGIFAIAAKLLGAATVMGIDTDPRAIETAQANALTTRVEVHWKAASVEAVHNAVDTVLMNPPFGAQSPHADRPFLQAALANARVVYTLLNAKAEPFVRTFVESRGGTVTDRAEYAFPIPRSFRFHREAVRRVGVVLYRIEVNKR